MAAVRPAAAFAQPAPAFTISLAQWSLHKELQAKTLDNLDFAKVTRQVFGIDAVEYVNQFFKDKANDAAYLAEMNRRAKDHGVYQHLIMCDGEGRLGDPDAAKRTQAVENHYKWVTAAKTLGCATIRVNAASEGTPEEQMKLAADGLRRLSEFADPHDINVIVENHGGLSSHGDWLVGVMKLRQPPALRHAAGLRQLLRIRPLQGRGRADAVRQGRQRQDARLRREGRRDHEGLPPPDADGARRRVPLAGSASSTKATSCPNAKASRPRLKLLQRVREELKGAPGAGA